MWDFPTILALALAGLAFASQLLRWGQDWRHAKGREKKRLMVAGRLREGRDLLERLHLHNRSGPFNEIERDIVRWADETRGDLPPEVAPLFDIDSGIVQFSGGGKHQELKNYLERRVIRLQEIQRIV